MPAEKHTFDPDGDLLLQLSQPAKKKAKIHCVRQEREDTVDLDDSPMVSDPMASSSPSPVTAGSDDEPEDIWQAFGTIPKEIGKGRAGGSPSPSADEATDQTLEEDKESLAEGEGIDLLVSSRHMALASPVFKAMLRHEGFKEGHILSTEGSVQVQLPDDNPRAMRIVCSIIHSQNRRVPRKVSLKRLASIAILVDKYQMVETVESYSDTWIDRLKPELPTEYITAEDEKKIFRWMEIAWVFGRAEEFKAMTCLVERGGYSDLDNEVVGMCSVPDIVIKNIMKRRNDALFECYSLIEQTIRRYQRGPEAFCPRTDDKHLRIACDSMLLGSLLKSASMQGLYPTPAFPYGRISFDDLAPVLRGLSVQALCDHIRPFRTSKAPKEAHGLKTLIEEKIQSLYKGLSGQDLARYKKTS